MSYGQSGDQPIPRIPLVVPVESRFGAVSTDAKIINGFAEKDEEGEYDVYKRPGTVAYLYTPVSNFYSCVGQAGFLYQNFGLHAGYTTVYILFQGFLVTSGGTQYIAISAQTGAPLVSTVSVPSYVIGLGYTIGFAQAPPATLLAVYADVGTIVIVNVGTATLSTATMVGVPVSGTIIWFDFRAYVIDLNANIWNSAIGDPTTWSSASYIQASQTPGLGVAIAQHESLVVAMKTNSIEFFYDAGLSPPASPLLPLPNSTINWGCVDANTVQNVENKLFWLASAAEGGIFVAKLDQRQHTQISTPGVDRLIQGWAAPFYSFTTKIMGHTFYGLTCTASNLTLVYDLREGLWYIWTDSSGNYFPFYGFTTNNTGGEFPAMCIQIGQGVSGGNYDNYQFSQTIYTDNYNNSLTPQVFPVDIYTPNYDSGSRRKDVLQRMDFIGDQQPGILKSRWNDDDYAPTKWSNFRNVDMNQKRPTILNNGSFRRRSWHFRWQEPYAFRLEAVELTLLPGTA
jgi:hypothetical protein